MVSEVDNVEATTLSRVELSMSKYPKPTNVERVFAHFSRLVQKSFLKFYESCSVDRIFYPLHSSRELIYTNPLENGFPTVLSKKQPALMNMNPWGSNRYFF